MPRLIDANALPVHKAYCVDEAGWGANFYVVDKEDIDNAPTIDAVPVVRCKECKHYKPGKYFKDINFCHRLPYYAEKGGLNVSDDDFCSYGERRSDD